MNITKRPWIGVPISHSQVDEWIKRLAKYPDTNSILSGDTVVIVSRRTDGTISHGYIATLRESFSVDTPE